MTAFVWWHEATAQFKAGLEQYYFMNNNTIAINPKAWYQSKSGWYVEGRYNYEAIKTFSIMAGKTFDHKSIFSYSVTPLAGAVTGKFNGVAIGSEASMDYKKISFSLQTQYTVSIENRNLNFMYTWADLGYSLSQTLSAGISLQQTNCYHSKGQSEAGLFLMASFGKWELPVYIFNPVDKERYSVLGLTLNLQ